MNARNAQLGGQIAVLIFIVTLLAFVTETQFTQVLAILPPTPKYLRPSKLYTVCPDIFGLSAALLPIVCIRHKDHNYFVS